MTMDLAFDIPRCRSDGKKGKGKGERKGDRVYSARHVRLAMDLQERRGKITNNNSSTTKEKKN